MVSYQSEIDVKSDKDDDDGLENVRNRVAALLSAVNQKGRSLDSKIIAAQEKLPIFKKKAELIRVSGFLHTLFRKQSGTSGFWQTFGVLRYSKKIK